MSKLQNDNGKGCDREDTSLVSDPCTVEDTIRRNQAVVDYNLWRPIPLPSVDAPPNNTSCPAMMKDKLSRTQRPSLGNFNPGTQDMFGKVPDMTRDRGRIEVFPRWTNGVPNMDKGGLVSDVDSFVRLGALGTHVPSCQTLAERDFDRFQPLVPMLATIPDSVYNTDLRVGKFTRDPQCAQKSQ